MLPTDPSFIPLYIAIATAIFSSIGFLFQYFFGTSKKTKKDKLVIPKLKYHPVFKELDEQENYFITRYRHVDEGRHALITEMVVHKIRIWRPILIAFAEKVDKCCEECGECKQECNKVLGLAIEAYLTGLKDYVDWYHLPNASSLDGTKIYTQIDKETMDVYTKKFQEWHSPREEMVRLMTHEIGESFMYDSCTKRAYDILQAYHMAFILMKSDSEKTLRSLNGSLTGKEFLGITIGNQMQ